MDKKIMTRLWMIASIGLSVAGLIFLVIMFVGKIESDWLLPAALICITLSNLFNVIRMKQ